MSDPIRLEETAADVMVRLDPLKRPLSEIMPPNAVIIDAAELARLRADAERMRHIDATAVDAAIAARKGVSDVSKRSD